MLSHWVHQDLWKKLENEQFGLLKFEWCMKHLSKEAVEPAVAIKTTYHKLSRVGVGFFN